MRVVIFFDLPMKTAVERKAYTEFRKNLIKEGFLMIQESVYVRVATTRESARFLENREQIEISRYYEKLPKPDLIATQEYIEGKIYYRNPAKEKEKLQ